VKVSHIPLTEDDDDDLDLLSANIASQQGPKLGPQGGAKAKTKGKKTSIILTSDMEAAILREGARNGKYSLQASLQAMVGTSKASESFRPVTLQHDDQLEALDEILMRLREIEVELTKIKILLKEDKDQK
jgi:hypothetical protein